MAEPLWGVEVPMKKVGDNEWEADLSGLSEDEKRILIESLKHQAEAEDDPQPT